MRQAPARTDTIGDADTVESMLDVLDGDAGVDVPEFWSGQVLDSLSRLFDDMMESLALCETSSELDDYRAQTKLLLIQVRDLVDQLWWSDWPAISSPLERDIRDVLSRVRAIESERPIN